MEPLPPRCLPLTMTSNTNPGLSLRRKEGKGDKPLGDGVVTSEILGNYVALEWPWPAMALSHRYTRTSPSMVYIMVSVSFLFILILTETILTLTSSCQRNPRVIRYIGHYDYVRIREYHGQTDMPVVSEMLYRNPRVCCCVQETGNI